MLTYTSLDDSMMAALRGMCSLRCAGRSRSGRLIGWVAQDSEAGGSGGESPALGRVVTFRPRPPVSPSLVMGGDCYSAFT